MAYKIGHGMASVGVPGDIDTVQRNPLGSRMQMSDGSEYIYLSGVASTVANDWVFYDELFATIRMVSSSVNGPVAIAPAAIVASNWGWYCIWSPLVNGNSVAQGDDDAQVFVSATAGSADDDSATGATVYSAIVRTVQSNGVSQYQICYPFVIGSAPA